MDKLFVSVLLVASVTVLTEALPSYIKRETEYSAGDCGEYAYCVGESFPQRVKVNDWAVSCEGGIIEDTIRENCCLPQERHLVCYDIKVEGQRLNYANETEGYQTSTDFSDLCQHMVNEQNRVPGVYNSASLASGEGQIAFMYGDFKTVEASDTYIVHLACGVEN